MKAYHPLLVLTAVATSIGGPNVVAAQHAPSGGASVMLHGSALPWSEAGHDEAQMALLYGDPGKAGQAFTFRLRVPDGFELGPHTHPVAEHMTVISGKFLVGIGRSLDRKAAEAYGPGSYLVIDANVPAYMWAEGETVIQIHGIGPLTTTPVEAEANDEGS